MDPNANLTEQLELSKTILAIMDGETELDPDDAVRLAELVMSLHSWLTNGGFLPQKWGKR